MLSSSQSSVRSGALFSSRCAEIVGAHGEIAGATERLGSLCERVERATEMLSHIGFVLGRRSGREQLLAARRSFATIIWHYAPWAVREARWPARRQQLFSTRSSPRDEPYM